MKPKNITIIGAGYVGLSSAALFSNAGYKVHLIDLNQKRLEVIKSGKSFFFEDGIDNLIKTAIDSNNLIPTDDYVQAIPGSEIVFSCVGTPDNPDGSSNLSYVFAAAEETAKHTAKGCIFVQKSTVPVGTGEQIEKMFEKLGAQISYVSNPEFLREGTAISDTLWFDRIVAGGSDNNSVDAVLDIYRTVENYRDEIAKLAGVKQPGGNTENGKYITTNLSSAELIKVTSNAFLALKISFANSIAKLADHTGADINEVMDAVGADRRIGRAFLNAGRGYGGGCFPKDVSGLISSANEHGIELPIMVAASDVNETMPGYIAEKAQQVLGSLKGRRVTVLGLAFKAGTSDARRSQGVKLANVLAKSGAKVVTFDPQANEEAKEDLRRGVEVCNSAQEALKDADAVFITTEWPELISLNLNDTKKLMSGNLLVDAMNMFDSDKVTEAGLTYIGVGR